MIWLGRYRAVDMLDRCRIGEDVYGHVGALLSRPADFYAADFRFEEPTLVYN